MTVVRTARRSDVAQFGRSYEEFEVGATYKHWPGKTVTEYDDHLFCLLTMNHHPLHLDAHYAAETTAVRQERRGRQLRLLAAARHVASPTSPARRSPTSRSSRCATWRRPSTATPLYGETTVLDKRESTSKDDRGVVYVETHRLQPGRHGRVHLPPQGDGAQATATSRTRGGEQPGARCRMPDKNWPGPTA